MRVKGFTLIESVIVILVTGIIAGSFAVFLTNPIAQYLAQARISELITASNQTLNLLENEIANAIPNSVRVKPSPGNYPALEFIPTLDGFLYRYASGSSNAILDVFTADTAWNIIGEPSTALYNAQTANHNLRIVIFNMGLNVSGSDSDSPRAGLNVYSTSQTPGPFPFPNAHVVTPSTTTATFGAIASGETPITLDTAHLFPFSSPAQRMYVFDSTESPVTFVCDNVTGSLYRYWGYTIQETQPNLPSATPLSTAQSAKVNDRIDSCDFSYSPGTSQRNGVVTVRLRVRSAVGEVLQIVKQIQLRNIV